VQAERLAMDRLAILVLLNLAILALLLLVIRLRIVAPLRNLAHASADFAAGRRGVRSGFRSGDEIGRLATAFDGMADRIEMDFRQLAADAAELERRELGLRKFSLAIEHSPMSVVITDTQGAIEYVNSKFSEMTGYAREEAIGRTPAILKSGRTPDEVYASLWRTLRSGQEWHGELLSRKKNGELFWEDVSIAPLEDAQGRITHFVAVKEDISGRKRNESAIAKLNAELEQRVAERTRQLEESNRQLESFSYSISHDLRAPLRAINGFTHLLEENEGPRLAAESREMLGRLKRNAVRMGELIDGLLELSRVTRKSLALERVDLSAMAGQILGELAGIQPSRPLQANIQEGLLAEGDATLLHAALENLLGNAWKFTAPRDIAEIAFGCREEGGERVFFVRDNGAGFDMKYADKLFGTFQRLHGQQEFEGNGIGLAMVRRIVTLHGGRVWAESLPGEGATFYFTLGAGAAETQPARN
ncbi:MAG: PAS domain S-box protein, partial [Rhodocyclaceae bacterium]|nr:PAS domain S-box protein [Rhodocyclaceae bacterium]